MMKKNTRIIQLTLYITGILILAYGWLGWPPSIIRLAVTLVVGSILVGVAASINFHQILTRFKNLEEKLK